VSDPLHVAWGEFDDKAIIKDVRGNLYEWRILQVDPNRFAGCPFIFGLMPIENKKLD
jgi:hypothetical protein